MTWNRRGQLKFHYNVTLEEYEELALKQNNLCALCNKPETGRNQWGLRSLCVDHCHSTNRIRGLLCFKCNSALGLLNDDVELLGKAIEYLK